MLFTLDQLIKRANIQLEDTVYVQDSPQVRKYIISAGDFFEVEKENKYVSVFLNKGNDTLSCNMSWDALEYYEDRLYKIKAQLKALKNDQEDLTHAHAEEIKSLRQEKKRISCLIAAGRSRANEKCVIRFKNCVYAASFTSICRFIPEMKNVTFRDVYKIPWFIANLEAIREAIDHRRPVGISGGPCLFGVNEVIVTVTFKDGQKLSYDFSSGRHFAENGEAPGFESNMFTLGQEVSDISYINRKIGVTTQEYDSIHCLFECAKALNAKLAIPLPDMSYIKYLKNIIGNLPEKVQDKALEDFKKIAFKISDMYLELIDKMKHMYPQVEVVAVHVRDEALCRNYYRKRAPYLTETTIRRLTGIRGKNDAVQDYITMPALPYYLWGIRDIIQMDSLDETDSYRKCAKIHKKDIRLAAMMYPERISGDGENTIFYAPLEYKEYLA